MIFLLTLLCCTALAYLLRRPLHKAPLVFYTVAVMVDVVFLASSLLPLPHVVWLALFTQIQKCILPMALFTLVMFIGCFSKESPVSKTFRPIRSELSVIACILSVGHVVAYGAAYASRITGGSFLAGNVMTAFIVAAVLVVLLVVLGVTSFNIVKKRMTLAHWSKIQKGAYVFFALAFIHCGLMLLPSALGGGIAARASIGAYFAVFGVYVAMRASRAVRDRENHDGSHQGQCSLIGDDHPYETESAH